MGRYQGWENNSNEGICFEVEDTHKEASIQNRLQGQFWYLARVQYLQ